MTMLGTKTSFSVGGGLVPPEMQAAMKKYPLLTREQEATLDIARVKGIAAQAKLEESEGSEWSEGVKLSRSEVIRLNRDVAAGKKARETFILSNIKLVVHEVNRKFKYVKNIPYVDILDFGILGLIHAVDKFDHKKGFKLSTYATHWIKQHLATGISELKRDVRLPAHAQNEKNRVSRASSDLFTKLQRKPTRDEIADRLKVDVERIDMVNTWGSTSTSLTSLSQDSGDEQNMLDIIPDDDAIDPADKVVGDELPETINECLQELEPLERQVLALRFQLGENDEGKATYEAIGEHLDMPRDKVKKIEARSMSKLRHPSSNSIIKTLGQL